MEDMEKREFIDRYIMHLRNKSGLRTGDFSDATGVSYEEFAQAAWEEYVDSGKTLTAEQCVDIEMREWEKNEGL